MSNSSKTSLPEDLRAASGGLLFAQIILFTPPYGPLTYLFPPALSQRFQQPGLRVLVPVGKTIRAGFIYSIQAASELSPRIKYKPILFPLETVPLLTSELLAVIMDLANRQGLNVGAVLGHILPVGLRSPKIRIARDGLAGVIDHKKLMGMAPSEKHELANALLGGTAKILDSHVDQAEIQEYSLAVDPPWPVRPAAKKQMAILDFLYEYGQASKKKLQNAIGPNIADPLNKLLRQGLITSRLVQIEEDEDVLLEPPLPSFSLNEEQRQTFNALLQSLHSESPEYRLVHGITGSGKTAVYLELARACISAGYSVLLLAPEVALAHKLYLDVCKILPHVKHCLYHGYQHPGKREKLYREISQMTEPIIVVGTRSAIFLPIQKLKCLILDEEHDGAYKQDENLPYQAKELAWLRVKLSGGLLVLGSATPDIRTFYAAQNGFLPKYTLNRRASGGQLPPIEILKIKPEVVGTPDGSILGAEAKDALLECQRAGEQAVILLNRRGYAPVVFCLSCQAPLRCPHCEIGLSFHKSSGSLVCHYCGYKISWPSPCPACGNNNFVTMGEGTERISEFLEGIVAQPVLRLDRDSVRRPGKIHEILTSFANGESPFLVGTQMLSKGHHFPNVTLVVVADGDIGMNLPDYRGAERTFQLLIQAAGRAGRGSKAGRAIIQTRNPGHYCWKHIAKYDYHGFYEVELARRKKYLYPPYTRLGLLRFSYPVNDLAANESCIVLGQYLRTAARELNVRFMGPVTAPMAVINGKKRMHCLMKGQEWEGMRRLWFLAQKHPAAKKLHVFLDLDPVNML